jgi:hypothetical protein
MMTIELADVMLPDSERVQVPIEQDSLPPITIGMYEAFLAKGTRGREALAAYQHLLYTYRKQGTNQPWATTHYLMTGLGMGRNKVRAAKTLLHTMGLIEYVQRKGVRGRMGKTYTRLNLLPNPGRTAIPESGTPVTAIPDIGPAVTPPSGGKTQMLEEETKCLGKESNSSAKSTSQRVKEKKPPVRNTGHALLTASFFEFYRKKIGGNPPWTGKDGALLKADLARLGADKLDAAIRLYFDGLLPGVVSFCDKAGWTYPIFHSQLGKLEEALAKEARRLAMVRRCPSCGQEQEHNGANCIFCGDGMKGKEQHVG